MKKTLAHIMIILALAAMFGCKNGATNSPTATATASKDTASYPFEADTDLTGWSVSNVSDNTSFISMQISNENPYSGNASLKVSVDFNAPNSGGILSRQGTNLPMAAKTITARIWVPADMFTPANSYGTIIFVQLANYRWYESLWLNLSPGKWNTITVAVSDMIYNGTALKYSADDGNTAILWGVRVAQGGTSPNYSGYIYIDSINVE